MIVVQNRLSKALRLAGQLIHRWDKITIDLVTPEVEQELREAEMRQEVWCFPSLLPPEPVPEPQPQVVTLTPKKKMQRPH